MDVRKKLMEIVKKAAYSSLPSNTEDFNLNMFVTNLLAHGVTGQEWISVDDRLPDVGSRVIACGEKGGVFIVKYERITTGFGKMDGTSKYRYFTYWMPLPQPPEGENDA